MDQNELKQLLEEIQNRLDAVENKRIYQRDIAPGVVKMRHIGEGVMYIQTGLAANRPTLPTVPTNSCMIYFETDTNKLYVWNSVSSLWKSVTLS